MKAMVLIALVMFSSTVFADFFFMLADSGDSPCTYTPVKTEQEAINLIKEKAGVACTAVTDVQGDILLTCKGDETVMFFFSEEIDRCVSMLASMKQMLGR